MGWLEQFSRGLEVPWGGRRGFGSCSWLSTFNRWGCDGYKEKAGKRHTCNLRTLPVLETPSTLRRRGHAGDAARRGPHALRARGLPPALPPPALQGHEARAAAALLRGVPARGVPRAHALHAARAVLILRHGEPVHLRGLLRCAAARHAGAAPCPTRALLAAAPAPVFRVLVKFIDAALQLCQPCAHQRRLLARIRHTLKQSMIFSGSAGP